MSNYKLKSFYDYYDALVEKWLDDAQRGELIRTDTYFVAQSNKKRNELVKLSSERLEIPEPFLGNPESCSAVIINLNPGMSGDGARKEYYETLAKELSTTQYSDFVKSFPCLEYGHPGFRFWSQKNAWIQRLCSHSSEYRAPFAVELCPYHSKKWNGAFISDEVRCCIQKWVLEPASAAVKKSQLPFALAIGKTCYNEFKYRFRFTEINQWTPDSNLTVWPVGEKGKIQRCFSLLEKDGLKILCTWCKGGNSAPSQHFSGVEQLIIQYLKSCK